MSDFPRFKQCPRDGADLASNEVTGFGYHTCGSCLGTWLPGAAVRAAMRPDARQALLAKLEEAVGSRLLCADCGSPMVVVFVNGCEIDVCPACGGLWLDRNEATRLASSFQPGSAVVSGDRQMAREVESHPAATCGDVGGFIWGVLEVIGCILVAAKP